MTKRRLLASLAAAVLVVGAGLATFGVFLAPTQAVEVELVAGVDAQFLAKQIGGSTAVAYQIPWCGGAGPGPEMAKAWERTYYVNINRGGEAEAFRRAQQIAGVRQAWLVPNSESGLPEEPGLIAIEAVQPGVKGGI